MYIDEEREEVAEVIRKLNEAIRYERIVVLVEGERDSRYLRSSGFEGKIVTFQKFVANPEEFSNLRVVLLIDLDRHGEELVRLVRQRYGSIVTLDESFRNELRRTKRFKRGCRSIEELFR